MEQDPPIGNVCLIFRGTYIEPKGEFACTTTSQSSRVDRLLQRNLALVPELVLVPELDIGNTM